MSPGHRHSRLAALRAENIVGVIVKQEEETRYELHNIAQYKERSAHIERLPSRIITFRLKSVRGIDLLKKLAEEDPETAAPVRPFQTLKFKDELAKQRFRDILARPIIIEDEQQEQQVESTNGSATANKGTTNPFARIGKGVSEVIKLVTASLEEVDELKLAQHLVSEPLTPTKTCCKTAGSVTPLNKHDEERIGRWVPEDGHFRHHPPKQQVIEFPLKSKPPRKRHHHSDATSHTYSNKEPLQDQGESSSPYDQRTSQENMPIQRHQVALSIQDATKESSSSQVRATHLTQDESYMKNGSICPSNVQNEITTCLSSMNLPPRNLPEHISYRVGPRQDQRLMKFQKPPNGWEGPITSMDKTDFSDPRFWRAPSAAEQDAVWTALQPTVKEYAEATGQSFEYDQARLLSYGYMVSYNHIHSEFSKWCFSNLESKHPWILGGKVKHRLFKLERWYGLLEDFEFAPNWPIRLRDLYQKMIQNPDCFACKECISVNAFCHGHREDYKSRCKPCRDNDRECSKTLA